MAMARNTAMEKVMGMDMDMDTDMKLDKKIRNRSEIL